MIITKESWPEIYKEFKEEILECLGAGWDIDLDTAINERYNSEFNFNNADPTTHMRCFSESEITDMYKLVINDLIKTLQESLEN